MHAPHDLETRFPIHDFADALETMWRNGWHPLDVARLIGTDTKHALNVYADALSLCRQSWHPQAARLWADQADGLGACKPWWNQDQPYWNQFLERHNVGPGGAEYAASLCRVFMTRPLELPLFEAPPHLQGWGSGAGSADSGVLSKVRALLAKAESTTFDEEAEALSAKAQQLIARHSIDIALLGDVIDVPGGRKIYVESPYAKPKFTLLAGIAQANNCRSCWSDHRKTATLVGHHGDMHLSEVLFTSLLLQGTNAILGSGTQVDTWGQATTRSWRNAFWYGYASRIGQRLDQASQAARTEHEAATGQNLLPVLAARSDEVDRVFDETFPDLATMSASVSNHDGLVAGRSFADKAELSADRRVGKTVRGQLSA